MKKFCIVVARILNVCMLTVAAGSALAQPAYPSKPIHFIVPFPPGGSTDPLARLAGQKLVESWGQQVIVENRAGGNTVIGTEAAARAAPDGYTIYLLSTTQLALPSLNPKLPYDITKDFVGVAALSSTPNVLVVHPSVPANNLQEFIALAKAKPGQLNFGTSGNGSAIHMSTELFNIVAGTKMQHVPYKGSGLVVSDLVGGQIQLSFQTPVAVAAHIKSGRLRAIAISGETRFSVLPQVPTFAEAGLPGYDYKGWFGVLAPAATPKDIVEKLSAEFARILRTPDTKEKLLNQGMDPLILNTEELGALIRADLAKYAKIVKSANIKFE